MIHDEESHDKARRAVFDTLLTLSRASRENPIRHHNLTTIAKNIPRTNSYGGIDTGDIPGLLEEYIAQNLVKVTEIEQTTEGFYTGYRVDLEMESEIEEILRDN